MMFKDADNPVFSSVTPLYAFTDRSAQRDAFIMQWRKNQGSYIDFYRSNGTRVFEAKYDPWGVQTIVTDSLYFHRGYGGHEMLNYFGIINMNGRLYDPLLGRFLSPDNYVQEPFNTQNLNRYSYCLNNPVKHTDPSGNFHLPSFLKFWKGALLINSCCSISECCELWNGGCENLCPSNHSERWYEVHASRLGAKHFDRHYGRGAVGYEKDNPKYFDMESFHSKEPSSYINPRTGFINYGDCHPTNHHKHSYWDYLVPFTMFW